MNSKPSRALLGVLLALGALADGCSGPPPRQCCTTLNIRNRSAPAGWTLTRVNYAGQEYVADLPPGISLTGNAGARYGVEYAWALGILNARHDASDPPPVVLRTRSPFTGMTGTSELVFDDTVVTRCSSPALTEAEYENARTTIFAGTTVAPYSSVRCL